MPLWKVQRGHYKKQRMCLFTMSEGVSFIGKSQCYKHNSKIISSDRFSFTVPSPLNVHGPHIYDITPMTMLHFKAKVCLSWAGLTSSC